MYFISKLVLSTVIVGCFASQPGGYGSYGATAPIGQQIPNQMAQSPNQLGQQAPTLNQMGPLGQSQGQFPSQNPNQPGQLGQMLGQNGQNGQNLGSERPLTQEDINAIDNKLAMMRETFSMILDWRSRFPQGELLNQPQIQYIYRQLKPVVDAAEQMESRNQQQMPNLQGQLGQSTNQPPLMAGQNQPWNSNPQGIQQPYGSLQPSQYNMQNQLNQPSQQQYGQGYGGQQQAQPLTPSIPFR